MKDSREYNTCVQKTSINQWIDVHEADVERVVWTVQWLMEFERAMGKSKVGGGPAEKVGHLRKV